MNFESVSVESPRLGPSQASSPGELKRNAAFGDDGRDRKSTRLNSSHT